jgi:hypothetical protein
MNSIEFHTLPNLEDGEFTLIPVIDGSPLPEILKVYEAKFAVKEGHSDLAGKYSGIFIRDIPSIIAFFSGDPPGIFCYEDKISILDCECGAYGCWPMLVNITIDGNVVTWSDFEQPHRTSESVTLFWDFSEFPSFKFSLAEYMKALNHAISQI